MKLKIDFKKFEINTKKRIQEAATKAMTQEIADEMADTVKTRTRLGYGVQGEKQKRLQPLKIPQGQKTSPYVEKRRKDPSLSQYTTPKKSNLTYTGQLLDAIKGAATKLTITLKISGTRSDGMENDTLRGYVEITRPFFKFTKAEKSKVLRLIRQSFLKKLARSKK